jgi:Leucine-rich repeat (LRR) protein
VLHNSSLHKIPVHTFLLAAVLDMSMNDLDGELPEEALSDIDGSNLEFLSLHSNKLSGPIPSGIGKMINLRTLDLSLNELSGDLPSEISNLTALNILFLGRNNYNEAEVPEWLRNMTQLTELSLKNSSFTGTIPEWMGELTTLLLLDLGENELTGGIPQTLNNLTELVVLILNKNRLSGELGLGQLQWLGELTFDKALLLPFFISLLIFGV